MSTSSEVKFLWFLFPVRPSSCLPVRLGVGGQKFQNIVIPIFSPFLYFSFEAKFCGAATMGVWGGGSTIPKNLFVQFSRHFGQFGTLIVFFHLESIFLNLLYKGRFKKWKQMDRFIHPGWLAGVSGGQNDAGIFSPWLCLVLYFPLFGDINFEPFP